MKKLTIIILVTVLLAGISYGDTKKDRENSVDIEISLGAGVVGNDGYLDKVKEYNPVDDGLVPSLQAILYGNLNHTFFSLESDFHGHVNNQRHEASIDFNRVLKQKLSFDALYHRLDHDPLTNIDVISEARSGAYATDYNPQDSYHLSRNHFESNTVLRLPMIPFLNLYVNVSNTHRTGQYQARTLSKCSACHVVAKTRMIDNITQNLEFGGNVNIGDSSIDYSFTNNVYRERKDAPTNDYLLVQHPEKLIPVFNSRIGVGNNETLPFDQVPESQKDTHQIAATVPVSDNTTLSANYVYSRVENLSANLNWTANNFFGVFSTRIGKKGFFNIRLKQLKIDNSSIFIDINEPVDVAGPNAGLTYAEAYGAGTFDWTRNSALSRSVWEVDANFRYRFSKQMRLRLGYEYLDIQREYFDVSETIRNTFRGRITLKPVKNLKFTLDGEYRTTSDPFSNIKGGVAGAQQTTAYPNPFIGVQFFQWHENREVNLTNQPTQQLELRGRMHWSASPRFALNGNIQWRSDENDEINYTGAYWENVITQYGLDMWFLPADKLPISASFQNYRSSFGSLFAIAALEGCGAGIVGGMTGTLTDMMDYDIENRTLLLNINYLASEKLVLVLNFNYNDSLAEIRNLQLDTSQLDYIPGNAVTALDFSDFDGIAEYSRLDIKQMIGELGFRYDLSKNWALNGAVYYFFYDDLAEYLFTDTTGKSYSFFIGFTWTK